MAQLQVNKFSTYLLTPEEETAGQIFSFTQICVLQNRLAAFAEERLGVHVDPQNPIASALEDAELSGQILLLESLINTSNELMMKQQQQQQQDPEVS